MLRLSAALAVSSALALVPAGAALAQKGPGPAAAPAPAPTAGDASGKPGVGVTPGASSSTSAGELDAHTVVTAIVQGLQEIHAGQNVPTIIWPTNYGAMSGCGPLPSSAYCPSNHTVYIAQEDAQHSYRFGDAALAYVVAHEYAHAMQTAFGVYNADVRSTELEADCLAGFYLASIPNVTFDDSDIYEIRDMALSIGDYDFMHPNHHGTPDQRVNAVLDGMRNQIGGADWQSCTANY